MIKIVIFAVMALLCSTFALAAQTITTTKTIQEVDAQGNIVNKTYVTKVTTSSVAEIKNSLIATSVQNEEMLFQSIQEYRKSNNNKNILKYSSQLAGISRKYAKELSTQGYFAHTSKDGKNGRDRLTDGGMKENTYRGEVLAQATDSKQALDAFKSSKAHNAILLEDKNYNIVGVGYYQGTRVVMFFTDKAGKYVDKVQPKSKQVLEKMKSTKKKLTNISTITCGNKVC